MGTKRPYIMKAKVRKGFTFDGRKYRKGEKLESRISKKKATELRELAKEQRSGERVGGLLKIDSIRKKPVKRRKK